MILTHSKKEAIFTKRNFSVFFSFTVFISTIPHYIGQKVKPWFFFLMQFDDISSRYVHKPNFSFLKKHQSFWNFVGRSKDFRSQMVDSFNLNFKFSIFTKFSLFYRSYRGFYSSNISQHTCIWKLFKKINLINFPNFSLMFSLPKYFQMQNRHIGVWSQIPSHGLEWVNATTGCNLFNWIFKYVRCCFLCFSSN